MTIVAAEISPEIMTKFKKFISESEYCRPAFVGRSIYHVMLCDISHFGLSSQGCHGEVPLSILVMHSDLVFFSNSEGVIWPQLRTGVLFIRVHQMCHKQT